MLLPPAKEKDESENIVSKFLKDNSQNTFNAFEEEVPLDKFEYKVKVDSKQELLDFQPIKIEAKDNILYGSSALQFTPRDKGQALDIEEDLIFRADDAMNYQRDSNLSIEKPVVISQRTSNYRPSFSELYNKDLINYFKTYFTPFSGGIKYTWNLKTCKIPYLQNLAPVEEDQSNPEMTSNAPNRSFRNSINNIESKINGLEYLKEIFSRNITVKNILDFKNGVYYDDGLINVYLRIIDVFVEYNLAYKG